MRTISRHPDISQSAATKLEDTSLMAAPRLFVERILKEPAFLIINAMSSWSWDPGYVLPGMRWREILLLPH